MYNKQCFELSIQEWYNPKISDKLKTISPDSLYVHTFQSRKDSVDRNNYLNAMTQQMFFENNKHYLIFLDNTKIVGKYTIKQLIMNYYLNNPCYISYGPLAIPSKDVFVKVDVLPKYKNKLFLFISENNYSKDIQFIIQSIENNKIAVNIMYQIIIRLFQNYIRCINYNLKKELSQWINITKKLLKASQKTQNVNMSVLKKDIDSKFILLDKNLEETDKIDTSILIWVLM